MWFLLGEVSASSGCLGIATLFNCGTPRAFHIIIFYDGPDLNLCISVGWGRSSVVCCLVHRGSTDDLPLLQISSGVVLTELGAPTVKQHVVSVESSTLLLHSTVLNRDLFVYCDDSLTS